MRVNAVSTPSKDAAKPKPPNPDIDWDKMGFGLTETSFMFTASCDIDGEWNEGSIVPFGNLSLSPAAAVLNYGQVRRCGPTTLSRESRSGKSSSLRSPEEN